MGGSRSGAGRMLHNMKQRWRRLLAVALALAMLFSLSITAFGTNGEPDGQIPDPADYESADLVLDAVYALADRLAQRNTADDGITQAICDFVAASDGVVADSVHLGGDSRVVWQTESGITCAYSPRLQEIMTTAEEAEQPADTPDFQTVSHAEKGGQHGRDVYLFEPYYGLDSSFTKQYQTEADGIAAATEGTYNFFKGEAATIDAIADAMESGGVIIFDSHGDTDYAGANEDYTSGATTSYLCLQSGEGLTTGDYADDHAVYGGSSGRMQYYEVDGTAIANHMEGDGSNGLVWMAICLGMATDGLEKPLMDRGLGVVYGYSQSVSFGGDYCYERAFFESLLDGKTVGESIADMKAAYGLWDYSAEICAANNWSSSWAANSLQAALQMKAAFPIVVSEEDPYPGHGKVDGYQTVASTWTLLHRYELTVQSADLERGSVSSSGMTITATPNVGYYVSGCTVEPEGAATVKQDGNRFRVSAMRQDCTITILFAAKTAATVAFSVPDGVMQAPVDSYVGDSIPLPAPEGAPAATARSYHFVGWTEQAYADAAAAPEYYNAGEAYRIDSEQVTLYALYEYFETADGETPVFEAVSDAREDWSGVYVVTGGGAYALRCDGTLTGSELGGSSAAAPFANAGLTIAEGMLTGVSSAYTVQLIRIAGSDTYAIRLGGAKTPVYLACRSNYNQLNTAASYSDNTARWRIAWENGAVTLRNARYSGRTLQFCADQPMFRCYEETQSPVLLYRGVDCEVWYTTEPADPCRHAYRVTARQDATCTQDGWERFTCTLCGDEYTEQIAATGHRFGEKASDELAQAASCTEPARYYVQCDACDAIDQTQTVAVGVALGHQFGEKASDELAQAANCTESARYYVQCDVCDAVDRTQTVAVGAALGHRFGEKASGELAQAANCTEPARYYVQCDACDAVDRTRTVAVSAAPGHRFVNGICRACGAETDGIFSDVRAGAWYFDSVAYCAEHAYMFGVGSSQFDPDGTLTRAQIVAILYRMAGAPQTDGECAFWDVMRGQYYFEAMIWAAENGIAAGYPDGSFRPDEAVTREELVSLLYRFFDGTAADDSVLLPFPDRDGVSGYAVPAMCWAVSSGIISGVAQGSGAPLLDAQGTATRAQIATILMNLPRT